MKEANVTATFGPAPGDWNTLSKSNRATLAAVYQHPLSHNLEWSDMVALFEKLGTVEQKAHNELVFALGTEHHRIHKPYGKDLTAAEVMAFRHMLSRAGWMPEAKLDLSDPVGNSVSGDDAVSGNDLMVVMDHHEARLYHLDIRAADALDHVIQPYDPHHLLHHLSHKDHQAERGQRTPEDHAFYRAIAQAIEPASAIVVVGHGKGHSNAAHHLMQYLEQHHAVTFRKVRHELVADLSSVTTPQLLALGRRALTPPSSPDLGTNS